MQKISRVNGDIKWNDTSELLKSNTLKEKNESVNEMNTNNDIVKRVRKSGNFRKGPTASWSDTGLMDSGLAATAQSQEGPKKLHLFLSAMNDELDLNLPGLHPGRGSRQSFFLSVKPFKIKIDQKNQKNSYLDLVQHEVNHLREKFELNNRIYQMDDLIRLTENSKKILSYGVTQKHADYDENGKSIYYNQECRRVEIERKVGLGLFLKVHERMINIINEDFDSNLKHSLEHKSQNLRAFNIAGDSDDIIKNKWKQIVGILDDKQEYLPDIWELAMSEYMLYHM